MEIPDDTVPAWIEWKNKTCSEEEAVVSYDSKMNKKSLTYSELYCLSSRFASILREGGLKKGDHVVNALPNCLEHIVTTMGVMIAGGVNIAVEVFMNTGETFYEVLEKTKTKLLIAQRGEGITSWNLIKDMLDMSSCCRGGLTKVNKSEKSFHLQHAFVVARDGTNLLDYLRTSVKESYCCPSLTPDDKCMAFSTSSSTSLVRLVLHTHRSIVQAGKASKVILHGERNYLNNTPPTWVTNNPGDFLIWGVVRVSLDHWWPARDVEDDALFADVIEKGKIETVFMIPPFAEAVMNKWKPRALPMVKHLLIGAMPVTEKMVQKLMPAAHWITVRYMSSEVPGISYNSFQRADQFHDFDSGVMETGVQARTVDENFKNLEVKKTGRILIKADGGFHNYIGEPPENTDDVFTSDGWFASLDAGFYTPTGHLAVLGRRDDMILHNVWNIHPSWIEKHIKSHKDVVKVVVVPVPDDINFQNICACVVQSPGAKLMASDITDHYRGNYIEEEKDSFCPTDVLFFDQLPEQDSGRIDRQRATDIATRIIQNARQKGVPSDKLKTLSLRDILKQIPK